MSAAADLRRALKRADLALAEAARLRPTRADDARADRLLAEARAELERAVAACGSLPAGLARRVQAVRARLALHARDVPAGALDGLYAAVRAETDADRWGRAGMSGAFLDAPRALARWRTAALAACVLLAVGVVVVGRAELVPDAPTDEQPLADPREELLRPVDAPLADGSVRRAPWHAGSLREVGVPVSTGGMAGHDPRLPDGSVGGHLPRTRDGFVLFHWHRSGPGSAQRVEIEAGDMLDAAGGRLRVRIVPPASQDERESN